MNLKIVKAVYRVVTEELEHLDQYPYIDSWVGLAQDPPLWMRFCIQKGMVKILMAQKLMIKKKFYSIWTGMTCLTPHPG